MLNKEKGNFVFVSLISSSIIPSRFLHVVANGKVSKLASFINAMNFQVIMEKVKHCKLWTLRKKIPTKMGFQEQSKADQHRAEQANMEQSRAEHQKPEQSCLVQRSLTLGPPHTCAVFIAILYHN